ncbi:helix-turn-helix domain-containing protein [Streptomyces sp. NBC_00289]|uniref:helix-turn-helix domain-containing protein n=1 Tax=Streptomyces sp. NBC_00289 TaxID=2975703 RepID=UPI00352D07F8
MLRWAGGAVAPCLAERARIVLACAEGKPNTRVAAEFKVTAETVRKWRSRFVDQRMAGLADEPRPGRRKLELVLSDDERAQLMRWARRAKTAQFLALRARIVLRCAEGGTNKQVAAELGVRERSVSRWRARFVKQRLSRAASVRLPSRESSR